jgi:hypothetical protein
MKLRADAVESARKYTMTFALLQTSMTPPPVDVLRRAFAHGEALSSADALFAADDAFGILARDLPAEEAQNIAANLAADGIVVELAAESDLPRLPDSTLFTAVQFHPEFLRLLNAREDATDIPYKGIRLLAVGCEHAEVRFEIVFGDAMARYEAHLEKLHFHHVPECTGRSAGENLSIVIRCLCGIAPHVLLNRGATHLVEGDAGGHIEDRVAYPRTSAFFEEMIWLLWRARRSEETSA